MVEIKFVGAKKGGIRMITFDDFAKVELKVGKILEVTAHPQADKLYILKVDIGQAVVQVIAGIRQHYSEADLLGKSVILVTNLEPRVLRGQESQAMLLAATCPETGVVSILTPLKEVLPGSGIK